MIKNIFLLISIGAVLFTNVHSQSGKSLKNTVLTQNKSTNKPRVPINTNVNAADTHDVIHTTKDVDYNDEDFEVDFN